eukprot:c21334_g1_i3 orf=77-901(-)
MACIIKPMTLGPQFYRETQLTAFNCKLRSTNAKLINPRKCHLGSIKACNWHTTEDNLHPERGLQKSPFLHSSWSSADIQRPENATNLQLINLLAFSWAEILWDVGRCIWRLPQKIWGLLTAKESAIKEVEEEVEEVAEKTRKTAKKVENAAKKVEKMAELVEEGAEKVESFIDKLQETRDRAEKEVSDANRDKKEPSKEVDKKANKIDPTPTSKFDIDIVNFDLELSQKPTNFPLEPSIQVKLILACLYLYLPYHVLYGVLAPNVSISMLFSAL